jgi:hypothetical protein
MTHAITCLFLTYRETLTKLCAAVLCRQTEEGQGTAPSGAIGITDTIWLFNIAMGNGPFIDGLPIKNGDFPWLS